VSAIKRSKRVTELCLGDIIEGPTHLDRVRVSMVLLAMDEINGRHVAVAIEHLRGPEHGRGEMALPEDAEVWVYDA
jgi:hypothetical protein